MLWQHVVLCKSYGAENVPDCGCVSCVMLHETVYVCAVVCVLVKWPYEMHSAKIEIKKCQILSCDTLVANERYVDVDDDDDSKSSVGLHMLEIRGPPEGGRSTE